MEDLEPGRMVSHYRVRQVIGRGGRGTVYLALDVRLGRVVALKVLRHLGAVSHEAFHREAQMVARVAHPSIVAVYDVGEVDGLPWTALEFVEGRTLRTALAEGRMSAMRAVRIAAAVAEALASAHAAGVLHRDVKPENILLGTDGRPRVVDFDLALLVVDAEGDGTLAGTPAYLAPERWRRAPATEAADIWAVGVVLYELLAGVHPWAAAMSGGLPTIRAALSAAPAAPELPPLLDVPPALADLVRRCLDPDPLRRPSARDLAEALDRLLRRTPVTVDECPFRGLLPFEDTHAGWFFGREADVTSLVEQIEASPRVALVGLSGVGKSSLVHAGILPRLRERGPWVVVSFRPGATPLEVLERLLERRLSLATTSSEAGRVDPTLDLTAPAGPDEALEDPTAPPEPVASARRLAVTLLEMADHARARVLLAVDQLEEIETNRVGAEEKRAFLEALATAAVHPTDPVRVVVTLRDDYLGRIAASGGEGLLRTVAVLRPLDRAALGQVLREPLRASGYSFDDPSVVDEMVAAVDGEPGALPLLQFAARRLWDLRDPERRLLRRADHDAMGGVAGALARHAEGVVAELGEDGRAVARTLLLRLVHDDGTRRPQTPAELVEGLPPAAEAIRDRLVQARLLSLREDDQGRASVELAHESLAVRWDRLQRWRHEAQDGVRLVADLDTAARAWERRDGAPDTLWSGAALVAAQRTIEAAHVPLAGRAAAFLAASEAHERAARTRRRRVLGGLLAAAAAITVGSVAAAGAYARQREEAVTAAHAAAEAEAHALVSAARAAWESGDRIEARARLRAGLERADSTDGRAFWSLLRREPLVWRVDDVHGSFQANPDPAGTHAVVAATGGLVRRFDLRTGAADTLRAGSIDVAAVATSPDGSRVAAVRWDGLALTWDGGGESPTERGRLPTTLVPRRAWLGGDGTLVVFARPLGDGAGSVVTWDLDAGAEPVPAEAPPAAQFAAPSPDGRTLAVGGAQAGVVDLWRLDPTPARVARVPVPAGVHPDLALPDVEGARVAVFDTTARVLDPDGAVLRTLGPTPGHVVGGGFFGGGTRVAALAESGAVRVWDVATGAVVTDLPAPFGGAVSLSEGWTTVSGLLVVTHLYGVALLDLRPEAPTRPAAGHSGKIDGLAVSPSGEWLASGGTDGVVILRDTASGRERVRTAPLGGTVNAVRFSPSGNRLGVAADGGRWLVLAVPGFEPIAEGSAPDNVVGVGFLGDDRLEVLSWPGLLRDIDLTASGPVERRTTPVGGNAYDLYVRADGGRLVGREDGAVLASPPGERAVFAEVDRHASSVYTVVGIGDRRVSTGYDDRAHVDPPGLVLPVDVGRVDLSPDGRWFARPSPDGALRVRDLVTGEDLALPTGGARSDSVAFSPDSRRVYAGVRGGGVHAWDRATGRPLWRGVALVGAPAAALTHIGWVDLGGGVPAGAWLDALDGGVLAADVSDDAVCVLAGDGTLTRWDRSGAAALRSVPATGATDVVVAGAGCAWVDGAGIHAFGAEGPIGAWGEGGELARGGEGIEVRTAAELRALDLTGATVRTATLPPGVTAATWAGGALCVGFEDGQVGCAGSPPLRGTPAVPVTVLRPYRDGLLAVGFADGRVGLWSSRSGGVLAFRKLDGAVTRIEPAEGALLALTATGDAGSMETSWLDRPWCDLVGELRAAIPITWAEERVRLAERADGACP